MGVACRSQNACWAVCAPRAEGSHHARQRQHRSETHDHELKSSNTQQRVTLENKSVTRRTQVLGRVGCAVRTAVNDGSKLLICVPRAAHSHDLWVSLKLVGRFLPTDMLSPRCPWRGMARS